MKRTMEWFIVTAVAALTVMWAVCLVWGMAVAMRELERWQW